MKILIDARLYGLEHAGIGRYISNLIGNLQTLDRLNDFVLLLSPKYFSKLDLPVNWKKIKTSILHYSLREQFSLRQAIEREKPNLVHFPHFNVPFFYSGKYIVTIHDLVKHASKGAATTTHNSFLYWFKYLGYKTIFKQAVRRAEKIIVPSQTVKKELLDNYSLTENKIIVTYEGVDDKFSQRNSGSKMGNKDNLLKKYEIETSFVIYTGSVYPHKNIERLIQSIKLINNQQLKVILVISCARSIFWERLRTEIKDQNAENYVKLLEFASDEELRVLYSEAKAFVFPSLAEGFGLPGLEAMACGLPVICSNIPVFREIYGEAVMYFDPLDIQDMVKKINKVLTSDTLRHRLISSGLSQVEKYSWKRMAEQTLDIYRELGKQSSYF